MGAVHRAVALALAIGAALATGACHDGSPTEGVRCVRSAGCPDGLACIDGACVDPSPPAPEPPLAYRPPELIAGRWRPACLRPTAGPAVTASGACAAGWSATVADAPVTFADDVGEGVLVVRLGDAAGTLAVVDGATGRLLTTTTPPVTVPPLARAWRPSRGALGLATAAASLLRWDLETGAVDELAPPSLASNQRLFVAARNDTLVLVVSQAGPEPRLPSRGASLSAESVVVRSTSGEFRALRAPIPLYDPRDFAGDFALNINSPKVSVAPGGNVVIGLSSTGGTSLLRWADRQLVVSTEDGIAQNATYLAVLDNDLPPRITVFRTSSGTQESSYELPLPAPVTALALDDRSALLAASRSGSTVSVARVGLDGEGWDARLLMEGAVRVLVPRRDGSGLLVVTDAGSGSELVYLPVGEAPLSPQQFGTR